MKPKKFEEFINEANNSEFEEWLSNKRPKELERFEKFKVRESDYEKYIRNIDQTTLDKINQAVYKLQNNSGNRITYPYTLQFSLLEIIVGGLKRPVSNIRGAARKYFDFFVSQGLLERVRDGRKEYYVSAIDSNYSDLIDKNKEKARNRIFNKRFKYLFNVDNDVLDLLESPLLVKYDYYKAEGFDDYQWKALISMDTFLKFQNSHKYELSVTILADGESAERQGKGYYFKDVDELKKKWDYLKDPGNQAVRSFVKGLYRDE